MIIQHKTNIHYRWVALLNILSATMFPFHKYSGRLTTLGTLERTIVDFIERANTGFYNETTSDSI